jgi:predicted ArsR family transcriptional regulator
MRRPQLVADLSALVNAGVVEVEQSKGRTPSRYRLARKEGDA